MLGYLKTGVFTHNEFQSSQCKKYCLAQLHQSQNASIECSESEANEIKELIHSLSLETDDETRRGKLASLLEEKLKQEDENNSAKFAHLWDTTLIQMGEEIQNQARADAEKKSLTQDDDSGVANSGKKYADEQSLPQDDDSGVSNGGKKKSAKELQLWAMVDMMIQSKSVIRKLMIEGKQ